MTDVFSARKRSRVMSRIRSAGNRETEGRLLAILRKNHITGWRRRLPLAGKPDFAFPAERLAVFVDGCFWHGCPDHGRIPDSNRDYWEQKLARNTERDIAVTAVLKSKGWRVVRFWDHDLADTNAVVRRLRRALTLPRLRSALAARHTGSAR